MAFSQDNFNVSVLILLVTLFACERLTPRRMSEISWVRAMASSTYASTSAFVWFFVIFWSVALAIEGISFSYFVYYHSGNNDYWTVFSFYYLSFVFVAYGWNWAVFATHEFKYDRFTTLTEETKKEILKSRTRYWVLIMYSIALFTWSVVAAGYVSKTTKNQVDRISIALAWIFVAFCGVGVGLTGYFVSRPAGSSSEAPLLK
jgi:hypothetical protein